MKIKVQLNRGGAQNADLVYENPWTVVVRLGDGHIIKRHKHKHMTEKARLSDDVNMHAGWISYHGQQVNRTAKQGPFNFQPQRYLSKAYNRPLGDH